MTILRQKGLSDRLPIHQGFRAAFRRTTEKTPALPNPLMPSVSDPNAHTPESKGFLVKVEKA